MHFRDAAERQETASTNSATATVAIKSLVLASARVIGTLPGFARDMYEYIDAKAFGTGTQLGQNIAVTLDIV